jgi:hypothetical protein
MWENLAAATTTGEEHEKAVRLRDMIAEKCMTRAQIVEAQRLASEWKPRTKESPE